MARVNIEDSIEAHGEFWALLTLVDGDRDRALGKLVRFFRLAQARFGNGTPITEDELRQENLVEMIGSRWAIPVEGGFECKGGEKHFEWYARRVKGGKARAKSSRDDAGRFAPKAIQQEASKKPASVQQDASYSPASHQPLALSLALALTQKKEEEYTSCIGAPSSPPIPVGNSVPVETPKKSKFSEDTRRKMRAFVASYAEAYRGKYGGAPEGVKDKALIGKLGHWIESVSEERACELAQIYLQVDYRPINESCHDLWNFFRHLNRIGLALQTGQEPGGVDWAKIFGGASR